MSETIGELGLTDTTCDIYRVGATTDADGDLSRLAYLLYTSVPCAYQPRDADQYLTTLDGTQHEGFCFFDPSVDILDNDRILVEGLYWIVEGLIIRHPYKKARMRLVTPQVIGT